MSVLGATNYQECQYVDYQNNFKSSKTRFVQVAMFEKFIYNWSSNDVAFVFLTKGTEGSEKKNWLDNGHFKYGTDKVIPSFGLKKLLADMNPPCKIEPVQIKNGDNEGEIWENFRTIFNCLQPGDEVYFDVTHGFRSLPMLVLVLNNYAKFLKNITITSITYGNYEARNEANEAPIIDLISLSELQNWTSGANMFIQTGDTKTLSKLLSEYEVASLNNFVDEINECRGLAIYEGISALNLSKELDNIDIHYNSFKELIDRIKDKVAGFQRNDLLNGFRSVGFCIEHKLIQQGVTLLQEFIVSYILSDIEESNWLNQFERNIVSGCLSINKFEKFIPSGSNDTEKERSQNIAKKVFELTYKKKLSDKVYKGLSLGARNDLNHAGKRNDPKDTGYFKEKLINYHKDTLEILGIKL